MKRTCLPLLAAAISVGILGGCATAPRTAEGEIKAAHKQINKPDRKIRRSIVLYDLSKRWDNFRYCSRFNKESLVQLQAIALLASKRWDAETKYALLKTLKNFADNELLTFYRQEGLATIAERRVVADSILLVAGDLKKLVAARAIKLAEYQAVWKQVETFAEWTEQELGEQWQNR